MDRRESAPEPPRMAVGMDRRLLLTPYVQVAVASNKCQV